VVGEGADADGALPQQGGPHGRLDGRPDDRRLRHRKQKSFQLAGNKVWWAQDAKGQRAWRCVFAQDGKPLRLTASSATPPTKLADVGLGTVAASAKRY
jgi:hypothetical protein